MNETHLFSPLRLREVHLRNRIVVSPMCQYSSIDGYANEWHLVHLGSRAVGGAGAVIAEATAVLPEGRISPGDLGLWEDGHIAPLEPIFDFIERHGAVPGIQLAHAGRKASTSAPWHGGNMLAPEEGGWLPIVSSSSVPFSETCPVPESLDIAGIQRLIEAFTSAADRALQAGAQLLEIHAAHGYLLHQFLSPLCNQRDDRYGGSFENRIRLVCDVVKAVRQVWPEKYPLFVRISATDWVEGGWDIKQSVELARALQPLGVDVIDCSSGGMVPVAKIPAGPGFQTPFAEEIRKTINIHTAAVGFITQSWQADQIIRNGQADLVLLGRELLRDPYWPLHAASSLGHIIESPKQYARAFS